MTVSPSRNNRWAAEVLDKKPPIMAIIGQKFRWPDSPYSIRYRNHVGIRSQWLVPCYPTTCQARRIYLTLVTTGLIKSPEDGITCEVNNRYYSTILAKKLETSCYLNLSNLFISLYLSPMATDLAKVQSGDSTKKNGPDPLVERRTGSIIETNLWTDDEEKKVVRKIDWRYV